MMDYGLFGNPGMLLKLGDASQPTKSLSFSTFHFDVLACLAKGLQLCFPPLFGLLYFSSSNFLSTIYTFTINTAMNKSDPHSLSAPRSSHDILVHAHSEGSQDSINISPFNSIDNMDNISLTTTNSPHTDIAPQPTFLRSPQSGQAQPQPDFIPISQHFAPRAPSTLIPADEGVKCEKDPSCAPPLPLAYPVSPESPPTLAFPSPPSPPQWANHNDHTIQFHYENVTFAKPQEVTIEELIQMEIKKDRHTWSPEGRAAYKTAYKENVCNPRKAVFGIHHIVCLAVVPCILGLILGWFD